MWGGASELPVTRFSCKCFGNIIKIHIVPSLRRSGLQTTEAENLLNGYSPQQCRSEFRASADNYKDQTSTEHLRLLEIGNRIVRDQTKLVDARPLSANIGSKSPLELGAAPELRPSFVRKSTGIATSLANPGSEWPNSGQCWVQLIEFGPAQANFGRRRSAGISRVKPGPKCDKSGRNLHGIAKRCRLGSSTSWFGLGQDGKGWTVWRDGWCNGKAGERLRGANSCGNRGV